MMFGKVSNANNGNQITHGYQGITWAVNNCAKIINCSWGSYISSNANQAIINWAINQGVIIVASAGNNNNSLQVFPAAYANVFAVANTNDVDVKSPSSSFGTWVDISAPGTDIYSTLPTSIYSSPYGNKTGTSMSAPLVSALCGLIWSQNPTYTPQMVLNCITSTAVNINGIAGNANFVGLLGAGRINAFAALQCSQNTGNAAFFQATPTTLCSGNAVQFTDASVTSTPITSWSWNFGDGGTSNLQSPSHVYTNSGTYSVTLTINAGSSFTWTQTNMINVIGAGMVQPAINIPICKGEEIQYNINFSGLPGYAMNYSINGGTPLNYATVNTPGQIYFNTLQTGSSILHINTITASGVTCPINQDIPINTINCCNGNLIANGDFNNGNTNFTTQQTLVGTYSLLCPGLYNVSTYSGPSAVYPGSSLYPTNKGMALFIDGRAYKSCPGIGTQSSCGINFPVNTELPCSNGHFPNNFSNDWRQNLIQLNSNYNYRLSFYTSSGNPIVSVVQPLVLRVRVFNQSGTPVFSQVLNVPTTNNHSWQQFAFDIVGSNLGLAAGANGIFDFQIEQFENFQWMSFDYMLDEIHLFRYIPLQLTSNIPGNNLAGGVNAPGTLTATPAGMANYTWVRPGNITQNTFGLNQLTNITVAGVYTCTVTDAGGCTQSSTILITDLCNNGVVPANVWNFSSANNTSTASQALLQFGNGGNILSTTQPILISGVFTVDVPLILQNCPNILMAPNAEIVLNNASTLTIDHCYIGAACSTMWRRIFADQLNESLIINNSEIRDMLEGVCAFNGAPIECINTKFTNNYIGIQIHNAPLGYNSANQLCIVRTNTFTSTGSPLLLPHNTQTKGENGIILSMCREVQIGQSSSSFADANKFNTLYNGIKIIRNNSGASSETYNLFDNDFKNIRNDLTNPYPDLHRINNVYTTHRGAGIYSDVSGQLMFSQGPNKRVNIIATPGAHTQISFDNCDKAVSTKFMSTTIQGYRVLNTLCGFMVTSAQNQLINITQNSLLQPHIGIQINGPAGSSTINNNGITLNNPVTVGANLQLSWPVGIDIQYVSKLVNNSLNIDNNTITLLSPMGTGIRCNNTGSGLTISNSIMYFNTTNAGNVYGGWGSQTPRIVGISVANSNRGLIYENDVYGMANNAVFAARDAIGYNLSNALKLTMTCNSVRNTRTGLTVWDDCNTSNPLAITCNSFDHHNIGMLVRTSGSTDPTLGDIGDATHDNNNTWANMVTGGSHIHRITPSNCQNYNIYKQSTVGFVSTAATNSCSYITNQKPLATLNPCSTCVAGIAPLDGNNSTIDLDEAQHIATDNVAYSYFPDVADYMDEKNLFTDLDMNPDLLNADETLSDFYNDRSRNPLGDIYTADEKLALLCDTLLADSVANDTTQLTMQWNDAKMANANIYSTRDFEMNEKIVNEFYYQIMEDGMASLRLSDRDNLEFLAKSCPYVEGPAVYKARSLWANYEPWYEYYDLDICNNAGQNKGGKGLFDDDNEALNNLISNSNHAENILQSFSDANFSVYPNPASTQLTLAYELANVEQAHFELLDVTGRIMLTMTLSPNTTSTSINISKLTRGVYLYRYVVNNNALHTGKIVLE